MIVEVDLQGQSRLLSQLMDMLQSGELCDFIIKSGNNSVKAHKCILAATSEYFRTSFNFSETCEKETSIDVSHLNCDITVIQQVIESLYSNQIDLDQDNVSGILHLADYLLHKDLTECIERFMENTLGLHNSIFYFRLCIQYNLRSTSLFGNIRRMLRGRFHDFLIYETDNLKLDMDVFTSMHSYGLLDNCTPLQLVKFFLNKLHQDALSRSNREEEYLLTIVTFLESIVVHGSSPVTMRWNSYLQQFLQDWLNSHGEDYLKYDTLSKKLNDLTKSFESTRENNCDISGKDNKCKDKAFEAEITEDCNGANSKTRSTKTNEDSPSVDPTIQTDELSTFSKTDSASDASIPSHKLSRYSSSASTDQCSSASGTLNDSVRTTNSKGDKPPQIQHTSRQIDQSDEAAEEIFPEESVSLFKESKQELCQILVVLAPSLDMASQLMQVEIGPGMLRPLLKAPKLCLYFYDIQLRVWKEAIPLDFPIAGYLLEKHSWRLAFANGNLYLFSLGKKVGLEYSLAKSTWTHLSCSELFKAHDNDNNEEFPVKSIIPVSVRDELVVLSMSREPRQDESFWTQQHVYQFDQETKTFAHVTVVRDERLDSPITQWTVKGDELFTVKASSMMHRDMSFYIVQYVHVYNAKSRTLKTHHIQSAAMNSGLKVLAQSGKLYLLNNVGAYQQLDLATSALSDLQSVSNPVFSPIYSPFGAKLGNEIYPALHRASCHGGASRWTVGFQDNIGSASLLEMFVNEDEEFHIANHPCPPFVHLTATCVAKIKCSTLDEMEQATFKLHSLDLSPMTYQGT